MLISFTDAKAILNNPSTYEILNPNDFGLSRYIHFASKLTGWNAIKSRAQQLNVEMTDQQYQACTVEFKKIADVRPVAIDDVDIVIRRFHRNLIKEEQVPLLPDLSATEQEKLRQNGNDIDQIPEKKDIDEVVDDQMETKKLVEKAKANSILNGA